MSWLGDLFGSTTGGLVESIGRVAREFITTDKDRQRFQLAVEALLQQRDSEIEQTLRAELAAKERMLVAELQQDDNYTKRARPTVVYAGLGFIFINYVLIPGLSLIISAWQGTTVQIQPLADLPQEFWLAWGGICSTWVIGRSFEKRGAGNRYTRAITGTRSAPTSRLLDGD